MFVRKLEKVNYMKKVLLVLYDRLERGGVQNVIMQIVRNLNKEYIFDIVVFDSKQSFYDNEFESYGGKIFRFGKYDQHSTFHSRADYYLRPFYVYKSISRILKYNGPYDVIHCHNALESGLCILAGFQYKVPVRIAHSHTSYDNAGNFVYKLYTKIYLSLIHQYSTNMVGCSEIAIQKLFESNDGTVIYNGIDLEEFRLDEYNQIEFKTKIRLIQVATFTPNKNQIFSLKVVNAIKKKGIPVSLTLFGRSSTSEMTGYASEITKYIYDNDLEDNVHFVSGFNDVPAELSQNEFLIFPSIREGFGIVPVEAQAMGLTCFISDSVPNDVDCGGCQFLNLSDGEETWADEIIRFHLKNDKKRNHFDCSRFSIKTICNEYRHLYEGLL